jgi:tetratricopeptide (TPR) repeat protein
MALEDIERLKEKIGKDPNSKLFVPLAEEYKKAGMLDEAIEVLVNGLEIQPGYLSARVSLGKIFIDRGLMHEAQAEFEKVIGAIPDNLYAHKKLAEIYRDLGEKDKSIREFKTVLKLNPMDEWAAASLSEIEQVPLEAHPTQEEAASFEPGPLKAEEEFLEISEIKAPDFPYESLEEISRPEEERPPGFSSGGEHVEPDEAVPGDISTREVEAAETSGIPLNDEDLKLWEPPSEKIPEQEEVKEDIPEISISEEDRAIWESHAESMKSGIEGEKEKGTTPIEEIDLWKPLYDMQEEEDKIPDLAETVVHEETPPSFEDVLQQEEASVEESPMPTEDEELQDKTIARVEDADSYILEGKYFSAMNVYRKILAREPDNKQILQRIEELRSLLKLLGKDKEELVSKLDSFLDGIRKRRDELLGSA